MKKTADQLPHHERLWLRDTRSTCSICHSTVDASIFSTAGAVLMEKTCPEHGRSNLVLSREVRYYSELSRTYFAIMPKDLEPHLISVTLTSRCALKCPVCFAVKTIAKRIHDITPDEFEKVVIQNPEKEFLLWGMEPTEHPQITEILSLLKKHRKEGYVLSNGLKLKDMDFLKKLRESGLSHIYFQFDGFDDKAYTVIRGRPLLKEKLEALENLKRLNVPTSLEVILAKGVNDDEIPKIIDYAIKNPFIRQVTLLPLIPYWAAKERREEALISGYHESLRLVEQKTHGRISLEKLRAFQKLMYVVYRFSKLKKCYFFTSFILVRDKDGGYKTIDEFIDLPMAEKIIDESLAKLKGEPGWLFEFDLILRLSRVFLSRKCLAFFIEYMKFILTGRRVKNSRAAGFLFIAHIENCENFKADIDMSERFCQEIMLTKNMNDEMIFKPGYQEVIDSYGNLLGRS